MQEGYEEEGVVVWVRARSDVVVGWLLTPPSNLLTGGDISANAKKEKKKPMLLGAKNFTRRKNSEKEA